MDQPEQAAPCIDHQQAHQVAAGSPSQRLLLLVTAETTTVVLHALPASCTILDIQAAAMRH
jgi:hypothetical protein